MLIKSLPGCGEFDLGQKRAFFTGSRNVDQIQTNSGLGCGRCFE